MKKLSFAGPTRRIRTFNCITLIGTALIFLACSKTEDVEMLTLNGRVLVYDGPEIGQYEELNTTYLKPFPGVAVFIESCKPWSGITGGGCTPEGRIEEMDITDAEGKYSITFRSQNDISYYPEIEYRSEYLQKGQSYSSDTNNDIILVPWSLIK